MKPNRQELRLILNLIFKVLIPMKWKMFKYKLKSKIGIKTKNTDYHYMRIKRK